MTQQTRADLDDYGMGEAAKRLYEFFWGDLCDWYIELVKSRFQADSASGQTARQVLAQVLEGTLRLLHPFMPHITEEVWQNLTQAEAGQYLALQAYPQPDASAIDPELEQQFNQIIDTIRTIRNLRAEAFIKPAAQIEAILQTDSERERQMLTVGQTYIQEMAKVGQLTISQPGISQPAFSATVSETVVDAIQQVESALESTAGQIESSVEQALNRWDLAPV